MKVLVIGGMHGNEPLGLEVVALFNKYPVTQVDTLFANKKAIALNRRFVHQDLNRSFPGSGDRAEYESRRAKKILKISEKYDVVLDFHNTYCPNNDCGFIGETAKSALTDITWVLGLDKIVVADYDCINKFASNCLSVEISLTSKLNNAKLWYEKITSLSRLEGFTTTPEVEKYRFVYRMTLEDQKRLRLDKQNLQAFQAIDNKLANALGVSTPAFPIFIGDHFTPYNYGGLLNKC